MSCVYLIHFSRPISDKHTCQHYLGYASDLEERIERHRNGAGARLLAVAKERGIDFEVVRVWKNRTRKFERHLKNQKNAKVYCPICSKKPRKG